MGSDRTIRRLTIGLCALLGLETALAGLDAAAPPPMARKRNPYGRAI